MWQKLTLLVHLVIIIVSKDTACITLGLKSYSRKCLWLRLTGVTEKFINKLAYADLLVLDDWGLEPLTPRQRSDLLELIDARYDSKSTLIASQLPIEKLV